MQEAFNGSSPTLNARTLLAYLRHAAFGKNEGFGQTRGGVCFAVLPLANISDPFGIKSDIGAAVSECEQSYAHLISATINRVHGPSFTL